MTRTSKAQTVSRTAVNDWMKDETPMAEVKLGLYCFYGASMVGVPAGRRSLLPRSRVFTQRKYIK